MLSTDTQTYSLNFRYYEQNINWLRTSSNRDGQSRGAEIFSLTSRTVDFSLEVRQLGDKQTETQAAVTARLAEHGVDISRFSHEGRSILDLSPEEASSLVADDGYWGINKTAARLADFVLKGAGNNLEMLRAGREGILRGYQEAEKIWGGELPEISSRTMEQALSAIDERIRQLGGSVIDLSA